MKGFLFAALALALSAAAAFVFLIDGIAKRAIETVGPEMLRAPVTVSAVLISPLSGKGQVRGLVVGNPEGFKTDSLLRLGSASIEIDLRSLIGNRIVVRSLHLRAPELTYEQGLGGSNISRLQKNLAGASGPRSGGSSRKFVIEDFRLSGGRVRVVTPLLNAKPFEAALPELRLKGIGAKAGGATVREALAQVLGPLARSAAKAATGRPSKTLSEAAHAVSENLEALFKKGR